MDNFCINLTTTLSLNTLPRINQYYNRFTNGYSQSSKASYFSDGITRATDLNCILQYSLEGCGETWLTNRSFSVPKNYAFINIINRVDTGYRYPVNAKGVWKFITFSFVGGNVREVFRELIDKYGPVYDLSAAHDTLTTLGTSIERRGTGVYSVSEMLAIYTRLIAILLESAHGNDDKYNRIISDVHNLVKREITSSGSIRFGVSEIANELGMSREYLSKLYHSFTGQTLKSYIDKIRIDHICHLIFDLGLTCAEAAKAVGIDYPSNLTAYFRRCTGLTPTQYRQTRVINIF